jgi:hypothetical protein
MLNQKKSFTSVLFFVGIVATLSLISSCKKSDVHHEEKILFPDDGDDREFDNLIVTYNVNGNTIFLDKVFPIPSDGSIDKEIWEKQQKAIDEHKKRFKFFADIIPAAYRKEITRFTVSYPEEGSNVYATIGRRKNSSISQFLLNISYDFEKGRTQIPNFSAPDYKHNTLGYDIATYAMIHEFGHYITLNKSQAYLQYYPESDNYGVNYKEGSFITQMIGISWNRVFELPEEILIAMNKSDIFNALPGEFVSAYACSSFDEDGAETFTHFVLLNDKPQDVDGKSKKILLFYQDPEMVKIRTEIRQNLQRMGIAPGKPNM